MLPFSDINRTMVAAGFVYNGMFEGVDPRNFSREAHPCAFDPRASKISRWAEQKECVYCKALPCVESGAQTYPHGPSPNELIHKSSEQGATAAKGGKDATTTATAATTGTPTMRRATTWPPASSESAPLQPQTATEQNPPPSTHPVPPNAEQLQGHPALFQQFYGENVPCTAEQVPCDCYKILGLPDKIGSGFFYDMLDGGKGPGGCRKIDPAVFADVRELWSLWKQPHWAQTCSGVCRSVLWRGVGLAGEGLERGDCSVVAGRGRRWGQDSISETLFRGSPYDIVGDVDWDCVAGISGSSGSSETGGTADEETPFAALKGELVPRPTRVAEDVLVPEWGRPKENASSSGKGPTQKKTRRRGLDGGAESRHLVDSGTTPPHTAPGRGLPPYLSTFNQQNITRRIAYARAKRADTTNVCSDKNEPCVAHCVLGHASDLTDPGLPVEALAESLHFTLEQSPRRGWTALF